MARPDGRVGRFMAVVLGVVLVASGCAVVGARAPLDGQGLNAQLGPLVDDGAAIIAAEEPSASPAAEPTASEATASEPAAPATEPAVRATEPAVRGTEPAEAEPDAAASPTTESGADKPKRDKPKVKTIRLKPRPRPGPFRMNLYRPGDFVHQQTKDWCVAGSTQTMMNIMDDGRPDRSRKLQQRLYLQGRRLSPDKAKLGPIGVDLTGWAELLNTRGYGPYVVDGAATRRGAIKRAAKALRMTGKPVGLVTWRGAHSWVMSGFTATADPAYSNDFRVKKVYIQDVWYPYVSTIWGASRPPNALVPVAALGEDFLPYRRPRARYPKRDGKYMLILPNLPRNTVAR